MKLEKIEICPLCGSKMRDGNNGLRKGKTCLGPPDCLGIWDRTRKESSPKQDGNLFFWCEKMNWKEKEMSWDEFQRWIKLKVFE